MKRILLLSLLLLDLGAASSRVWAQVRWHDLPPEERREIRQQMREHWRQENGGRGEENMPRWRDLTPEERQRLRDAMREQRNAPGRYGPASGATGWKHN